MDDYKKQQILIVFSNWMQVTEVRESKHSLIISGFLKPGETADAIRLKAKQLAPHIRHAREGYTDVFTIRFQKTIFGIPRINLLLFIATIFTTLFAGALMEGVNPLASPLTLFQGVPFSVTLLLILGVHETGHFLLARKNHVDATLPYFLPAPTIIGTFGAFIKMRSPVRRRRALVEIGAAGPIAGFLVAVLALFIGLSLSTVTPKLTEMGVQLGESILMKIATAIIYPGLSDQMDIMLHPVAFAAWIGMLVTMLNLLPIGQLDGGHIAYALLGKWYQKIAWSALGGILILSIFSPNWLVWAVLVYFLTRMKHPPIMDEDAPVTRYEKTIGIVTLLIFILTFIPIPFKF
ncbi:MAG: site-2 protease family protein [Candidatus Marinimicrobia bacterium]|nr:site-2 protease family protein [Candidatus Neomarinimicrobiota bacterium]